MYKLDENYLDTVRKGLYGKKHDVSTKPSVILSRNSDKLQLKINDSEASPKNTVKKRFKTKTETFKAKAKIRNKLKKKVKPKQVTFIYDTSKTIPETTLKDHSNKVKDRVATPFKNVEPPVNLKMKKKFKPNLNDSQYCKIVPTIPTKLSPSLHENGSLKFYPLGNPNNSSDLIEVAKNKNDDKSKKRLLSESRSPEVNRKRKKVKSIAKKGKKLMFDDSLDESELDIMISGSSDIGQSNTTVPEKKKTENKAGEKSLNTNFTLETSWQNETEFNHNNTWENFIYSFKNDKDNEKTEKPRKKKLKNNIGKTDGFKSTNKYQQNITELTNSHKITTLELKTSSKRPITDSTTVDKKSDYKNERPSSHKVKKIKTKGSIKTKSEKTTKKVLDSIDSLDSSVSFSDIEFNPKANFRNSSIVEHPEEVSDSCDNETVGVKGLKFQRFCNLFPPIHNEQFVGQTTALSIPKKYFEVSENDLELDWQCEELPNLKHKEGNKLGGQKKSDISNENVFENSGKDKEVPITQSNELNHADSPNKKKVPKKKIHILNVQILGSQFPDSNSSTGNQKLVEEISDSEDDLRELSSQKKSNNYIDVFKNNETDTEVPISGINEVNYADSLNKKKVPKKKNNILEGQILTENFIQSYDKLQYSSEKEDQISIKHSRKPIILTLKNGNKVIALNLGDIMHFHGLCQIKVLNGELEILGATINSNSGDKKLYSPRGTSLLYIRNKSVLFVDSSVKLNHLVPEELLHVNDVRLTFEQHYAIFLCTELKEPYIDFIERYISQKIFPESSAQELRVDFKLQGSWNKLQTSEKWEDMLENISKHSKTVISGGKRVGKSTFLRYAVNFLIRRFDKIKIIDLDPGQSEFYSPGSISVVTVDKEVFGPNYTHLLEPVSSILSHINIGYDIKKYLKSVWYLLESTKSMEALPTVINFPGFTQGIGLDISAQLLKLVEPTLVIQIDSKTHSKNYRMDMTADKVSRVLNEDIILRGDESSNMDLSYDFVKLESLAENNEAWSLDARQGREMNILSYFGKLMTDCISDLTSADINMYRISISALSITNLDGKTVSPLAINANLVALCSKLDKTSDIFSCQGYGFVRGIDIQTDTLLLITPETLETLENVSHLVLSSVTTPPSLIMTANGIKGHIPYVSVGHPVDFGQFTKRSYLPPRKSF